MPLSTIPPNLILSYFAFACLLYSVWRAVDLLVQVELTGRYDREPVVTAQNTLTLLLKETGIGQNGSPVGFAQFTSASTGTIVTIDLNLLQFHTIGL